MKKTLLLILLYSALFFPATIFAQITRWDFTGPGMLNTSTAAYADPGLSSTPILTRAGIVVESQAINSFRTTKFAKIPIAVTNPDYFQFTLSAASGKKLSLSTIDATYHGTQTYCAAPGGALNQFAYSLNGEPFTLIGTPTVVTKTDGTPKSVFPTIDLSTIAALQNIPSTTIVTFRYYASGQTTTGGWGFYTPDLDRNQGLKIGGILTDNGANTQPVNASGYPKVNNITPSSIDLLSNINVAGTTYYTLIPATGTAPATTAQVKNGLDGNGSPAFKSGSLTNTANLDAVLTLNGLSSTTAYKLYVVSADSATPPNLQTTFTTINAVTAAPQDLTPPVFVTGYPKVNTITSSSLNLLSNINEAGTTYYVLIPATGAAPTTPTQVKNGLDGTGSPAFKTGSFTNTANMEASVSINSLNSSTAYILYVVAADAATTPNLQATVTTVNATTIGKPLVNSPIIISQYYEGTSVNKWIELTNLGNTPLNTASPQLKLALYNISGDAGPINITATPSQTVDLNVIIPAQGSVLIGNTGNGGEVPYLTAASAAQTSNTVINFNGNDGVAILDASNNIIDAFGQGVNAKDVSYVRNITVTAPSPVFIAGDWTRLPLSIVQNAIDDDDLNSLGVHFPPNLSPCAAPTVAPTTLAFSAVTTNSITASFTTSTDANEYLVIRSTSNSLTVLPQDGTTYNAGTAIGGGIVAGRIVNNNLVDNNLLSSTKYYYFIFPLNNISCTGGPKYLTTNYLTGTQTTKTLAACATPANQPANFTITSSNYNFVQASYTLANDADEYLVVMSTSNSLTANPVNQTVYNIGDQIGGGIVIKRGTGNSFIRNGLAQNTTYYFYIFALNSSCSGGPLYLTAAPLTGIQKTGILDADNLNFYYGNLHSHSSYSDGNKDDTKKTPKEDYEFAKNSMKMDFLGISEHNHTQAGMSLANWKPGIEAAKNATTSTFLALHGMEWGVISGGGHVIVYGIDSLIGWEPGENQIYVPKSTYTGKTGLFNIINRHGLNAIATLAHPNTTDYNNISATYDISADSAIVGAALESGPAFSTNITYSDPASSMSYLSYYNRMLARGYHLGATIDHDNHNLTFGRHTRARLVVLAPALTENDLFDAMKKMRFYASEDSAAKVTFLLNKEPIGSVFTGAGVPEISVNTGTTSPVTSIKLFYGTPGNGTNPVQVTSSTSGTLSFTHDGLANLTTGYYYADIVEADGSRIITSPIWYSRDDSYVKKTQTITFIPERSATYGDPDLEIGASSDNPAIKLTYTSSDPKKATVTDGKIQILNTGKVTITTSQKGDAYFSAAAKQQILTIIPKSIFVKAEAKQKLTGTSDPALTYTTTSTLLGTAAFTGNLTRDAGENPGNYTISRGTLALDTNYLINYTPATLQIIARPSGNLSGDISTSVNSPSPVITFTAKTGTAPFTFTYTINAGPEQTVTSTGNTASVTVPTSTAGIFTYTLTNIKDVNSSEVQNVSSTVTIRPLPTAMITGTGPVCVNGLSPTITFTGAAGTAPYTFSYTLNGSSKTITTNTTIATIKAPVNNSGIFTYTLLSVTDAYGAQSQTGSAVITINELPLVQIISDKGENISKGDVLQLTATGGVRYSWTGSEILAGQNSATLTIRPKQSGTYKVSVMNISGCSTDQTINITVNDDYKLEAGTLVTPNGDGINDKFVIKNIDYYPNNTLKIFDKAGRVFYTKHAYANDWDGTLNGSALTAGTYYYILDLGPGLGTKKGYINILRD
ncbi:gliding motility-associated C-terminal domain-containing protein [Pedobacter sp. PAMC26386]|nr:gliding motility-associated C-terminal domain-containing protein [Pedobacter sp. PAMC26386]